MNTLKPFPGPEFEDALLEFFQHPEDLPRISTQFIIDLLASTEMNWRREKSIQEGYDQRTKGLESHGRYSNEKYHTQVGIIFLRYPELKDNTIKPYYTIEILEQVEEKWKRAIADRYFSGESIRDLQREAELNNNKYSRGAIDNVINAEYQRRSAAYEHRDFKNEPILDLQTDALYDSARLEDFPKAHYKKMAKTKCIGFKENTLTWEDLGDMILPSESIIGYEMVFDDLINHNLGDIYCATTDLLPCIRTAIMNTFAGITFNPCRAHQQIKVSKDNKGSTETFEMIFNALFSSSTRQEALDKMDFFSAAIHQISPKSLKFLKKHFKESINYLDYPEELYSQMGTSNKLERFNEAFRRRSDAMYSCPSKDAMQNLDHAVSEIYTRNWPKEVKGNAQLADRCKKTHFCLYEPLALRIEELLEDSYYRDFRSKRLSYGRYLYLRINIWVIPFKSEDRNITTGLLTIHGIDSNKKEKLLHCEQIKHTQDREGVKRALKNALDRGLRRECVSLIIFNRPYHYLTECVKEFFPRAQIYNEASSFLERLLYLIPEDHKKTIDELFRKIYETETLEQAKEALQKLKKTLKHLHMEAPLEWLNHFNEHELLSVIDTVEKGKLKNYQLSDFEVHQNWKTRIGELTNHPLSPEEGLKDLIKTLSRKKYNRTAQSN